MKKFLIYLAFGLSGVAGAQDWSRYDHNGDGRLDQTEWNRSHFRFSRPDWLRFDSNSNGIFEPSERRAMLREWSAWRNTYGGSAQPVRLPPLKPVETFWDHNGDGVLSVKEREKMRSERQKMGRYRGE